MSSTRKLSAVAKDRGCRHDRIDPLDPLDGLERGVGTEDDPNATVDSGGGMQSVSGVQSTGAAIQAKPELHIGSGQLVEWADRRDVVGRAMRRCAVTSAPRPLMQHLLDGKDARAALVPLLDERFEQLATRLLVRVCRADRVDEDGAVQEDWSKAGAQVDGPVLSTMSCFTSSQSATGMGCSANKLSSAARRV